MRSMARNALLVMLQIAVAACGGGGGGGGAGTPQPDPGAGASEPHVLVSGATFHPDETSTGQGTGFALGKLITDSTHLYWFEFDDAGGASGGRIRSVPLVGGSPVDVATGLGSVNGIATDGMYVYYSEVDLASGMGTIERVPVGGGPVEVIAASIFVPTGPAVDDALVYWSDHQTGGAIMSAPKSGGSATPVHTGLDGGVTGAIVVDATTLFFSDQVGRVHRVPLAGGSLETLASGFDGLHCLLRVGSRLYGTDQTVPRGNGYVDIAGGPPVIVEADGATNIFVDATHHYWTRNDAQVGVRIFRQLQAGGQEELLGFGGNLGVLNSLVVVGGTVYLLDVGGHQTGQGRILRL